MSFEQLPDGLPNPIDDGGSDHLLGMMLPSRDLMSTSGHKVNLTEIEGYSVVYFYPLTGVDNVPLPAEWDSIPGARGCTPQACAYRDAIVDFDELSTKVFGVSTQSTTYQLEFARRKRLGFPLLSDEELLLANSLRLPTFVADGMILLKRLTLIILDGRVVKVFYPVFPPDSNAAEVIAWLKSCRE
jgi:peroxiredoxin